MSFLVLKHLHVAAVALSILGFVVRAGLMLRRSRLADAKWVRRTPHYIDSVLLGAALGMLWVGARNPFAEPWLSAKLTCLVAYIVCGALALKRAPTQGWRIFFLVIALVLLANMVAIALSRDPAGLLRGFNSPLA